jgi:hypothetical protein
MRVQIGQLVVGFGHWIGGTKPTGVREFGLEAVSHDGPSIDADVAAPACRSEESPPAATDAAPGPDPQQQVRQLIKQALEAPTAKQFTDFLDFTNRFRRLGVWNARMTHIQRPGATAIASEFEWRSVGREVLPDAVPIIILWPFSPIRFVYELADTGPPIDREKIGDPFAATGVFKPKILKTLIAELLKQKTFIVEVEYRRHGFRSAGSAASQGTPQSLLFPEPLASSGTIGQFSKNHASIEHPVTRPKVSTYRIVINDRLTDQERFVTLGHELGHIFCGHVGECLSNSMESGWPDRRQTVGENEQEIEAEAVAYLIAARAGLVTASSNYLQGYVEMADIANVNTDLIVRAAARIERLAKISYGTMSFKRPDVERPNS